MGRDALQTPNHALRIKGLSINAWHLQVQAAPSHAGMWKAQLTQLPALKSSVLTIKSLKLTLNAISSSQIQADQLLNVLLMALDVFHTQEHALNFQELTRSVEPSRPLTAPANQPSQRSQVDAFRKFVKKLPTPM